MNKNIFYKYTGSNKAVYIFNLSSFKDIFISLEFYKPLGLKRNILKKVFATYLCGISLLSKFFTLKILQNTLEVNDFLSKTINKTVNFNIDNLCSIFISATGDKVIVNHENNFFEKFAFLNSYNKACHEIKMYELITSKKRSFLTSEIKDINILEESCSFKLYNKFTQNKINKVNDEILIDSLVEFFNVGNSTTKRLFDILAELKNKNFINRNLIALLNKIENKFENIDINLGLTHWDFKIWNIQPFENKILIYDFEETKSDGLPLEDFYNYYIDAKIMAGNNTDNIIEFINTKEFNILVTSYLKKLEININPKLLLLLYLLNRIVFYDKNGGEYIVNRYLSLLEVLEKNIQGNKF